MSHDAVKKSVEKDEEVAAAQRMRNPRGDDRLRDTVLTYQDLSTGSLHKRKTRDNATGKELLIMKEGINRTHTGNRKSNVRRQKLINNGIEKRETLMRKDIRAAGINT